MPFEMHALPSSLVPRLMFDYENMSRDEVIRLCGLLPRKVVRWIAMHHPDNRARVLFFQLTGVPVGEGTVLNANLTLYDEYMGLVTFGERVAVATDVTIVASSNANNSRLSRLPHVRERLFQIAPVLIEDDAWLGTRSVVLPGVTVGRGGIVAAGAVVTQNVPARTLVAGIPAQVVRTVG